MAPSRFANILAKEVQPCCIIDGVGTGRYGPPMAKKNSVNPLTASQRSMRARAAVHASWANTEDRKARTEPARQANLNRFEKIVDPEGKMEPAERALRAESARKAHYTQLAYRSARARAARKTQTTD
jgi:hypothetical protein